jgi:hypothetical protein
MLQRGNQLIQQAAPPASRPDHLTRGQGPASDDSGLDPQQFATASPALDLPAELDADKVRTALQATVRLRIEDEHGISYGTGTVIDNHDDELLVLTCAHIFNAAGESGQILCDLFVPGGGQGIRGKLISRDIRRDVGLVSFRSKVPVTPVQVGGTGNRPGNSDMVFCIGCNRGNDPTVLSDRILAVNRYHGPANLVVGGRPVDGRSGGGLFTSDGLLIGVCNAADQTEDEGLYAALGPIHTELDAAGLGFIYRREQPAVATRPESGPQSTSEQRTSPSVPLDTPAQIVPTSGVQPSSPSSSPNPPSNVPSKAAFGRFQSNPNSTPISTAPPAEVICIVRSNDRPNGGSQVYVLDRPSPNLMKQLSAELDRRGPHQLTNSRTNRQGELLEPDQAQGNWRPAR